MNLTVVHHIPGRIRWRSANCFTRSLAETIAEKLDAIAGVEGVRVSPRCGSILITYSTKEGLLTAVDALAGIRTDPPQPSEGLRPRIPTTTGGRLNAMFSCVLCFLHSGTLSIRPSAQFRSSAEESANS